MRPSRGRESDEKEAKKGQLRSFAKDLMLMFMKFEGDEREDEVEDLRLLRKLQALQYDTIYTAIRLPPDKIRRWEEGLGIYYIFLTRQ